MEIFECGRLMYYRRNVATASALLAHLVYVVGLMLKVLVFGMLSFGLKKYDYRYRYRYFFFFLKVALMMKNIRLWI